MTAMTLPSDQPPDRYRGLFEAARRQLAPAPAGKADSNITKRQFLDGIRESDLLSEEDWSTVITAAEEIEDPHALAGQLVERQLLTAWQCRTLLEGRRLVRLEGYELLSQIGAGGMGVVYKARQTKLNRIVAVKMIRAGELASEEDIRRFQLEAEAAAKLDHPNIVPVYEVGARNGQHYFSMGYVEGQSLREKLADGPLPPRRAAGLIHTVATAIAYAHENGVIHRDLKPGNVLIDAEGNPRITDFGLAKQTEADSGMTATGQIVGTPSYMPPEQAAGNTQQIGPTADVYALGAVLYCLLTGRPPFQAAAIVDTLRQVLEKEPVSPRVLNADVNRDLETICLKCLQKSPEKRYPSAMALADDLARHLAGKPILARPVGTFERTWRFVKRRPAIAALIVASAIALTASAASFVFVALNQRLQDSFETEAEARQLADDLRGEAERARSNEQRLRGVAEGALNLAEDSVYSNHILMAHVAFNEGERRRCRALLDACDANRRNWEWHFLNNRFHAELQSIRTTGNFVAFSPDGRWLAGAGGDLQPVLWNAATGKVVRTLPGGRKAIAAIRFSADGSRLTAALPDEIRVWNPVDGKVLHSLAIKPGRQQMFAIDRSGRFVARVDKNAISVWDAFERGRVCETVDPGIAWVRDVSFSVDGQRVISVVVSREGKSAVEVRDARTGRVTLRLPSGTWTTCAAFNPDGLELAIGANDGRIEVWDVRGRRQIYSFQALKVSVDRLRFSPDGRFLAAAGADKRRNEVRIWQNTFDGAEIMAVPAPAGQANDLIFNLDGRQLAVCDGRTITLWDATDRAESFKIGGDRVTANDACFSPDGRRIAASVEIRNAGKHQPAVVILTIDGGSPPVLLPEPPGARTRVAFSPDARLLATSGDKATPAKIWDAKTGRLLVTLPKLEEPVLSVAFNRTSDRLATTTGRECFLWNANTGARVRGFAERDLRMVGGEFLPSSDRLLILGNGGKQGDRVVIWNAKTGRVVSRYRIGGDIFGIRKFALSADGSRLATGGSRGCIVFDANTGEKKTVLGGASDRVDRIAFSPDGRRVAMQSLHTVRLWDAATGLELLSVPRGQNGDINFSPDGRWFAVGLRLYDGAKPQGAARGTRRAYHARTAQRWHLSKAYRYRDARLWHAAAFHFQQLARYEPGNAQRRIQAGQMLFRIGRRDAAHRQFRAGLRAVRGLSPAVKASFHAEVGQYEQAEALYRRLVDRPDSKATTKCSHALALLAQFDAAGYRERCRKLLKDYRHRGTRVDAYNVAWLCNIMPDAVDDPQALVAMAKRAVDGNPRRLAYRETYGAACYRAGDYRRAATILAAATANRTDVRPDTLLFLAMALRQIGEKTLALETFRGALKRPSSDATEQRPAMSWTRREAVRRLRSEALRLFGPVAAPRSRRKPG